MDVNSSGWYGKNKRRTFNRSGPAWRRSSAQRAFPTASSIPFSFRAAGHGQPRRRGRRSAGRSPLGVSKSKSFEGRSQFSTWLTRIVINAALMRRRSMASRPAMAVGELKSKNEAPLTDRLVSKSLTPEQLLGRMEIREMFKEHLEELPPILRTVFL